MEQANKLNDAVKALGSLQEVLGGIDLSELKVGLKIKKKITALQEELKEDIRDSEFFSQYDTDTKPEDLFKATDFEDTLFREALETLSWGGSLEDLDLYSVEEVISSVNDLSRTIHRSRREIGHLEDLLR